MARQTRHALPAGLAPALALRAWPARRWIAGIVFGVAAAIAIGVPTGIVKTGFYTRMTAVTWWDYPVWLASAALVGMTAATYVRSIAISTTAPDRSRRAAGATVLATFAVGCPVCNKLIVALLGVGGALNYWAPLQPLLGVASVSLLAGGLLLRLRGEHACRTGMTLSAPAVIPRR